MFVIVFNQVFCQWEIFFYIKKLLDSFFLAHKTNHFANIDSF